MFNSISNFFKRGDKQATNEIHDSIKKEDLSGISIYDEKEQKHLLTKKLGQGGQGIVYKTSDKNLIVKLQTTGDSAIPLKATKQQYENYKSDIDDVRILAIPPEVKIAKPIEMLKFPLCGYTMLMLDGMEPIKKMILVSKDKKLNQFYYETGGLKKRLEILKETAKQFMFLHCNSFVYGDISAENIFISHVSKDVWLIDSDNLRTSIDFTKKIETPGFAAPEVHKKPGCSNTTFSDEYSFSRLAYLTLTLSQPFEGELLINGSGGWDSDESKDYYELAEQGEVPWVGDEDDDSNFSEKGIPMDIVLSNDLSKLFQKTFGKQGRIDPMSRPTMSEWYIALTDSLDNLIDCPGCKSTYYNNYSKCPFCDSIKLDLVEFRAFEFYNNFEYFEEGELEKSDILEKTRKEYQRKLYKSLSFSCHSAEKFVRKSFLMPILAGEEDSNVLKIETVNNQLRLTNISDLVIYEQKTKSKFTKNTALATDKGNQISFYMATATEQISILFGFKF